MTLASHDMTTGSPARHMTRFAIPLLFSYLFQQFYSLADGFVVGRLIGVEALAAVGATGFYSWTVLSVVIGFTHGCSVLFGQLFGAKNEDGLQTAAVTGMLLTLGLGLGLSILGIILARPILAAIQTPAELLNDAATYLYWILGGTVWVAAYNLCAAVLRSMGDSKTPVYAMVISGITNVVLDFALVALCHMGVSGVAVATVVSQLLSALICLYFLRGLLRNASKKPHRPTAKKLIRLGTPMALNNAVISVGGFFVQEAVNQYGTALIAGITTAKRYFNLMEMAGSALEGAVATFVSQNAGSGKTERISLGMRFARRTGICSALVVIAVIFLFAKPLITLIVGSEAAAIETGVSALKAMALCIPALYMLCMFRAAIQGMGNTLIPMFSGFAELILRLATVTVGVTFFGMESLYFADGLGWIGAMVLVILAYIHIYRCISGQPIQEVAP